MTGTPPSRSGRSPKNHTPHRRNALNAYGITSIHSDDFALFSGVSWREVQQAYRELEEAGELTVRVYEQSNFSDPAALREFVEAGNITGTGSQFFRIGPLKLVGDGALGARTAYLCQSYADDPETQGFPLFSQTEFDDLIGYANESGMQVAIHGSENACLDMVINIASKSPGSAPCRSPARHVPPMHRPATGRIARTGTPFYAQASSWDTTATLLKASEGGKETGPRVTLEDIDDKRHLTTAAYCPVELAQSAAGRHPVRCNPHDLAQCTPTLRKDSPSTGPGQLHPGRGYAALRTRQGAKFSPECGDFCDLGRILSPQTPAASRHRRYWHNPGRQNFMQDEIEMNIFGPFNRIKSLAYHRITQHLCRGRCPHRPAEIAPF